MALPKRELVPLDDATIAAMASNQRFLVAFPFLTGIGRVASARTCGSCGTAAKERSAKFGAVKRAFAGMGEEAKRKLKEMLNAKKIRVTYLNDKKVIELTF